MLVKMKLTATNGGLVFEAGKNYDVPLDVASALYLMGAAEIDVGVALDGTGAVSKVLAGEQVELTSGATPSDALLTSNNLADLANAAVAWANLGGPARVLSLILTGFVASGGGPVTSSDSILTAIQKLQAQIDALSGGSLPTFHILLETGDVLALETGDQFAQE